MYISPQGQNLAWWGLVAFVSGIVWCFIKLPVGLISIFIGIFIYIIAMVREYNSQNVNMGKGSNRMDIQNIVKLRNLNEEAKDLFFKAFALTATKNFEEAKNVYDKLIMNYPDFPEPYTMRAGYYAIERKWDKCIEDCNVAIELDETQEWAYYGKVKAYEAKGDSQKAKELKNEMELLKKQGIL